MIGGEGGCGIAPDGAGRGMGRTKGKGSSNGASSNWAWIGRLSGGSDTVLPETVVGPVDAEPPTGPPGANWPPVLSELPAGQRG